MGKLKLILHLLKKKEIKKNTNWRLEMRAKWHKKRVRRLKRKRRKMRKIQVNPFTRGKTRKKMDRLLWDILEKILGPVSLFTFSRGRTSPFNLHRNRRLTLWQNNYQDSRNLDSFKLFQRSFIYAMVFKTKVDCFSFKLLSK